MGFAHFCLDKRNPEGEITTMNVNNQPSFGANFKWANKKSPEIVATKLLEEQSSKLTEAIERSKSHGGDDITHALNIHFPDIAESALYDYKGTLNLPTGKKRTLAHNSIKNPEDFSMVAAGAAQAFETIKKHNLSQKSIDKFNIPAHIVEYGKQLDLEG